MRELYPDNNFAVIGEIGGFARPPNDRDRLLTRDGKVLPILPRGSLKRPFEWVTGYVTQGNSLTIYAQSIGSNIGRLTVTGSGDKILIKGGTIISNWSDHVVTLGISYASQGAAVPKIIINGGSIQIGQIFMDFSDPNPLKNSAGVPVPQLSDVLTEPEQKNAAVSSISIGGKPYGNSVYTDDSGSSSKPSHTASETTTATPAVTLTSDTTVDFSVNRDYQFKTTSKSGTVPSLIVSTAGVFETQLVRTSGNDYCFRLKGNLRT